MIFEKKIISLYERILLKRRDNDGRSYVFKKEDFPGLESRELFFEGDKGQRLCAYVYYRGGERTDELIMFDHGMGCGHASYMTEIDALTRRGHTVFTYDHTGTLLSGGENIGGFSQSLSDLDRAVKFVRSMKEYESTKISVVGHSWGGYSTMNIVALHPEISHVVALSGFVSPKLIQEQVLVGVLRLYRPTLFNLEREALPDYYLFDARESLGKSDVKALIIHSRDDRVCNFKHHFLALRRALEDKERIQFLVLDKRGHYPHYTEEGVKYKVAYKKKQHAMAKRGKLDTDAQRASFIAQYDLSKMHEQDEGFWDNVSNFLNS
jgi:pimeloyl-ACP methyl ester carboxylesterase